MANIESAREQELQHEIAQLRKQLSEAQRMTALGELLSTTTHEFNNVLMSVLNYAKMGLRHKDEATRTNCLEKILAAGERAAKISKTVLAAARNRSDSFEATNLASLIDDVLVLLERELRKYRISVEKEFQPTPPAWAMGNQIQQVLINLMINSRQAMPDGGRLIIRLRHDLETNTADVTIRDTGTGIPAETLPKIFDRYFTTKNGPDETGKGGSGLGLAACREIVEAHRGRVRVESTVGVGTAFTIKLPLAPQQSPTTGLPIVPTGVSVGTEVRR